MQGQGLWMVGEFEGFSTRTVSPKEGGKVFEPFVIEELRLIVNDDPKVIGYREGKRPDVSGLTLGDVVVIGVRVRDMFNGQAQFDGRSVAVSRPKG